MYLTILFFLMLHRPPMSPLFPYTTLFRSISSSVRLRLALQVAWTPPWLETTGRLAIASTSATAAWLACATSTRSEEHTSELQSHHDLVCRLLLEKKKHQTSHPRPRISNPN